MENRMITFSQALNEALREEMNNDTSITVLGEDVGKLGGIFRVTKDLQNEFGEERVKDTPMSEEAIVGCGVGAAMSGMRPVVEIMYMDFFTLACDQICNWAAKLRYMSAGQHKIPLVIRTQVGMGRGYGAQHAQSLESWVVHSPGIKVVMPSDAYDAKGLLKTAIRDDNPVVFIEHNQLYFRKTAVPTNEYFLEFGKAEIKKEGTDLTLVALSYMVNQSIRIAEDVEKDGISVEVIDPRTLVPFDLETVLESVKKTGRLLVVHESWKRNGIGTDIVSQVVEKGFSYLKAAPKIIASKNYPLPSAKILEKMILPQKKDILEAIISIIQH